MSLSPSAGRVEASAKPTGSQGKLHLRSLSSEAAGGRRGARPRLGGRLRPGLPGDPGRQHHDAYHGVYPLRPLDGLRPGLRGAAGYRRRAEHVYRRRGYAGPARPALGPRRAALARHDGRIEARHLGREAGGLGRVPERRLCRKLEALVRYLRRPPVARHRRHGGRIANRRWPSLRGLGLARCSSERDSESERDVAKAKGT